MVAEYGSGRIADYEVNANGDPILSLPVRTFISGFLSPDGPEGAAIDPLTGDFLFSTYGGNQILRVTAIPEAGTGALLALGLAILVALVRLTRAGLFSAGVAAVPAAARALWPPAPAAAARSDT